MNKIEISKIKNAGFEWWIVIVGFMLAVTATIISYSNGTIVAYGDAESHLNIAKRVIDSMTPGFAQLGGIWLPLPHVLLIPFVSSDFLWRTGLAGSIVSGIAYIISALYIFKLMDFMTKDRTAAFFAALVFMTNPNILYMQATPMTELTLIAFFLLSSYYFIRFIEDRSDMLMLVLAAFFGLCASLSRYDGWALVLMEAGIIFLMYIRRSWKDLQGITILFSTLAFFGIGLWLAWGWMILGDPLYFTHSQFSANSQQQSWLAQGELPAYKDIASALTYYSYTSLMNIGLISAVLAIFGILMFVFKKTDTNRWYILLVLLVPFIFNVATLYMGESVIFIPGITPNTFRWNLFNVRYGIMMMPAAAICIGYLFYRFRHRTFRTALGFAMAAQCIVFGLGYAPVITLADGTYGLSSHTAKISDAERWLTANYDYGLILQDDFSRTISIIRSGIPMDQAIYVGNKPYWEESLMEPEKYARWIVMQHGDTVWTKIYDDPGVQSRLFGHFNKVYTSDEILIFKRIE